MSKPERPAGAPCAYTDLGREHDSPFVHVAAMVLAACLSTVWAGSADDMRHGRYLMQISGCNDCHPPGFMQNDGKEAEADKLRGGAMGWQGPWGTTYASDLRLPVYAMDEAAWLARSRQPMRPPMPSPSLRAMNDDDLKAMYRYIKSLGPRGVAAPGYVPPGGKVATPYLDLHPKNLPQQTAK